MKRLVSHRLEEEFLEWAGDYAKSRGTSRAVVIEEGLRHFRELAKGGVPDLPVPDTAEVKKVRAASARPGQVQAVKAQVPGVTTAGALLRRGVDPDAMARQRKLNEAKARSKS